MMLSPGMLLNRSWVNVVESSGVVYNSEWEEALDLPVLAIKEIEGRKTLIIPMKAKERMTLPFRWSAIAAHTGGNPRFRVDLVEVFKGLRNMWSSLWGVMFTIFQKGLLLISAKCERDLEEILLPQRLQEKMSDPRVELWKRTNHNFRETFTRCLIQAGEILPVLNTSGSLFLTHGTVPIKREGAAAAARKPNQSRESQWPWLSRPTPLSRISSARDICVVSSNSRYIKEQGVWKQDASPFSFIG
ncbi:hypothetical protein EJ110_NYTH33871 [Nymphaea thermarum]|nr:hypothetical protein EJ110_NYTH33871 [Nymphaea thermarum]